MTTDAVGGVWHYSLELARCLERHGIQTILALMGPPPVPAQRRSAAGIRGLELVEAAYRLEWMPGAGTDLARAGDWLLRLEARYAPDIIHVNGYAHAALPWRAPVILAAHSCVRSWWLAVHGAEPPAEWRRYAARVRQGIAAAGLVVAPTAAFLQALQRLYGAAPNARVIRNGRDPAGFAGAFKEPMILTVGRIWDEAKNIAALAAVAPHLDWPVVAAGEARHPARGTGPGLGDVRHLGDLDEAELAGWLARAAVFALPARYEPFGLAALEAALSGCALVLGDIPTLRELWDGAALFVRPDDHEALRQTLQRLTREPALRLSLADAALHRACSYTAEGMADGYRTAYADLLHGRDAGVPAAAGDRPASRLLP